MKTKFFLIGMALFACTNSFSQVTTTLPAIVTTEEEYNYVRVGYPLALSQGYDVKQGYSVKDLGKYFMNNYNVTLKAFYRDGVTNPIAILIKCDNKVNPPDYYCIPTKNTFEFWNKIYKYISSENLAGAKYEAITYALMSVLSENMLAK